MEKLRCAVIGLGMGQYHVKGYAANPRAELVGIVDLDETRLSAVLETVPETQTFTDYKRMFKECKPQVVSVALPNFLHEPVSVDCMEAGADVMCEKPMSTNLESALRMEHAAVRTGRRIFTNPSGFVRFENGASLLFETSWAGYQQTYSQESLKLIGTKGGIETVQGPNGQEYYYNQEVGGVPLASRIIPEGKERISTDLLVDCILDDTPFPANMEDGLRMQVILEALYQSAQRGHEVNVKTDFPEAYNLL